MNWTPESVWERTLEAHRVLARLPDRVRPRAYGSGMPQYVYDADDIRSQQERPALNIYSDANAESEAMRQLREARNRPPVPSAREVADMDQAFHWQIEFLKGRRALVRGPLNACAIASILECDLADWLYARRWKIGERACRFAGWEGVKMIAGGLNGSPVVNGRTAIEATLKGSGIVLMD